MTDAKSESSRSTSDDRRNGGVYLVLVRRRKALRIKVGALGWFDFPAGWYIYTGKSRRGLRQRAQRHWSPRRRVRWHVDYLTAAPGSEPIGAVLLASADHAELGECWINQRVGAMLDGSSVAPGFGASDCMSGCPAHLWFTPEPLSLLEIARISPRAMLLVPQDGDFLLLPAIGVVPEVCGEAGGGVSHD
jgi:Uri superfamily endonuclease